MRKLFFAVVVVSLLPSLAKADLKDQIKLTLIDNVQAVTQIDRKGDLRPALLDSVVLLGSKGGTPLGSIQVGFAGSQNPGANGSADLLVGAFVRVDPALKSKVNLPAHWEFLKSLEFGPAVHYSTQEKKWFGSIQLGLTFDLNPVQ